ncbi:MAG TPA: proline dehydrogenase family protein [Candidatus Krumholzibacteria bacterium]|nr:proline dehydrogenase family protein [Candidatus Krumholzibacteria bacterium]
MSFVDRVVAATLPAVPKPIVRKVAGPYIAGEHLDDLLRVSRAMNGDGYMVAAAILGEFVSRKEESLAAVGEYKGLLASLSENKIDAYIHVKPTHMGLKIDRDFCLENIREVLRFAGERGQFVRLDMEDSTCIDDTLAVYYRLREDFDNVGVVIQARMRRSLEDIRKLASVKANVRICKGIYIEPHSIAYTDPELISRNFTLLLEEMIKGGCYAAIATHDERLVFDAYRLLDQYGVEKEAYEFQMLLGVLAPLRGIIHDAGHRLRVAVPYGPHWYAYSVRRLRKNPAVAGYVLKAMLKG